MPALTHENVLQILECVSNYCDSRKTCFDCVYSQTIKKSDGYTIVNCALDEKPYRWKLELIKKEEEV